MISLCREADKGQSLPRGRQVQFVPKGRQGSICTRRADKDYSVLGGRLGLVGARRQNKDQSVARRRAMISLCQKADTDQVSRGRQRSVHAKRQTRISLQSMLRGRTRYRVCQEVDEDKSMTRSRQGSVCA